MEKNCLPLTTSSAMASAVLCPLSPTSSKLATRAVSFSSSSSSSSSIVSHHKIVHFHLSSWLSPLGRGPFSPWIGLKHLGLSTKPKPLLHIDRKGMCKGKVVYASLFGVGAPEVLVIGVVALLVFGPKGLAEVARNLGKTLRAFQPTIRELQDVSREFKSTLEREIGLDEISSPTQSTYNSSVPNTTSTPPSAASTNDSQIGVDPNGTQNPNRAYSSEEYLKISEEQLKAAAAHQQGGQTPPPKEDQFEPQVHPPANETATSAPTPQKLESET